MKIMEKKRKERRKKFQAAVKGKADSKSLSQMMVGSVMEEQRDKRSLGDDGLDMAEKFKKQKQKQGGDESSDEDMPQYDPSNPFAALAALKKIKKKREERF